MNDVDFSIFHVITSELIHEVCSMNFFCTSFLVFLFSIVAISVTGQKPLTSENQGVKEHLGKVNKLLKVNLMADALVEVEKALKEAKTPDEQLKTIVTKAEILRASEAYQLALECLWTPSSDLVKKASIELRIKRLGRLAAVHQEYGSFAKKSKSDSVLIYIDSALNLALSHPEKNQLEIASLYNEIGLYVYRKGNTPDARSYYQKSCKIFSDLNELELLVTPLSNLLELESCTFNRPVADSISLRLVQIIEGKNWPRVKLHAYTNLAIASRVKHDEAAALRYDVLLHKNAYDNLLQTNSEKMLTLREIYERDKLEQQVESEKLRNEKKARQLEISAKDRRQLILLLTIAFIVLISVLLLFFRERILKQQIKTINEDLNTANERYELLVIESNHRIKNNLQMISAMLDYTKKGLDNADNKVLKSISGKINTISSLHKFLHSKEHNEHIPIRNYFNEIVLLYANISPREFRVDAEIVDIGIRSERIVYFGLILNEMLSNTIEHAPSNIDSITLKIVSIGENYRFVYKDLSKHSSDAKDGTGAILIKSLCNRIGGKEFHFTAEEGKYEFDFEA